MTERPTFHELARDVLADADLTITHYQWLPGQPIPYDTMRAILGLPDVRAEVQEMRAALGIRRALKFVEQYAGGAYYCRLVDDGSPLPALETKFNPATAVSTRLGGRALDLALDFKPKHDTPQQRALPRPSTTPPMWATNPTRTRRRRNR